MILIVFDKSYYIFFSFFSDPDDDFPCDECEHVETNKFKLKLHMKRKHLKPVVTYNYPRTCDQCDHIANSKSNLWYHMRSKHIGEKYPCDQCEYSTPQLSSLKVHIQSKHEGKQYLCDECDYISTFLTGI